MNDDPPPMPVGATLDEGPTPARMARFLGEVLDLAPTDPAIQDHPGLIAAHADGFDARELLGAGGVGEVFRGVDCNTGGQEVAIKVQKRDAADPQGVFAAEARALTRLSHPYVIRLIRQGGDGVSEFLVLELVDGLPLDQFAQSRAPSMGELLGVFEKVCATVGAVHAANLIHADLKPGNILVRDDGSPVLIDFGLACRPGGEGTAVARRVMRGGTHVFLAPELRGAAAVPGRASDLYALGETFRRVSTLCGHPAPAGLSGLLDEACAADPARRPASAAALAAALAALRVPAPPPASPRSAARWYARVSAVLVLVVLGAAALVWRGGDSVAGAPAGGVARGVQMPVHAVVSAQVQLVAGDSAAARAILEVVPPGARGWEWRHLWAFATQPPVITTRRYPEAGVSSVLGPDGGYALVGTVDGRLYRTGLDGGVDTLHRGAGTVSHLAVIDAERFVAIDRDGQVLAGDGAGMRTVGRVAGSPSVCWPSPDAARVSTWDSVGHGVSSTDVQTGRSAVVGRAALVVPAASSPGWAWAVAEDKNAERDGSTTLQHALMGPGWIHHRADHLLAEDLPLAMDHDPGCGSTVLGTVGGQLRYYAGPGHAPATWDIADHPLSAVVLSEQERRVFVVGDRLYVFDLDRGEVALTLPIDLPGLVRGIRWNPDTGALTLASDLAMTQWKAPHAGKQLASR